MVPGLEVTDNQPADADAADHPTSERFSLKMLIDTAIRDNVLLPLLLFVAILTILRGYLFRLLMAKPDAQVVEQGDVDTLRQKNIVARSQRLRTNLNFISSAGAAMRKDALLDEKEGELMKKDIKSTAMPNPMAMMDGMKVQIANQGMYMGIMYAIQNVLAGFLVVKLPFSLTERFKQLTQQGIGVSALDTSYVASGSWYMIASQGLARVLQLVEVGSVVTEQQIMQMQMMGPAGAASGQPFTASTAFAAEASAFGVTRYSSALLSAETELLQAARRLPRRHAR